MSCLTQTEFKSELQVVEGFFDVALMIVQTEYDLQVEIVKNWVVNLGTKL